MHRIRGKEYTVKYHNQSPYLCYGKQVDESIKWFFKDMITDAGGGTNSKIFVGLISFIVAVILAFLQYPTQYPVMFLTFSGSCFGFSCFDNKSAFQFKNTSTETKTEIKNTDMKLDVGDVINNTVNKLTKRSKKK